MNDAEKAQLRMGCVIEASKLKQNPTTAEEHKSKSVVEISKELEEFVLKGA